MVWLVIAVVLVAAVGPVLWLLPTRRDRQLAELRAAARRAGLSVEVTSLPKLDATAEERVTAGGARRDATVACTCYRLPLPRPLAGAPRWLLREAPGGAFDGWTPAQPPRDAPAAEDGYWRRIAAIANGMPGGCLGLEARPANVAWYGIESAGDDSADAVVESIRAGLAAVADMHRALDRPDGGE